MSQALVRYLVAQQTVLDGATVPLIPGVFAIFGHGNVAGLGEALAGVRDALPTHRAHNEQAMAHAAIAYAKAMKRRQFMACTTSIGPGATNMVTAAALAHVNRLPVLLLPGDVFASRRPDPVLQQVEDFSDPHGHGQRLLSSGVALLGPHHAAGTAAAQPAAGDRRADRSRRMRTGDARAPAGCAGGSLGLSARILREAHSRANATGSGHAPARDGRRADRSRASSRSSSQAAAFTTPRRAKCLRSSRHVTAFLSPRRRPAKAPCPGTIRSTSARSA